ncbi:MAG: hypothetical protein ACI8ZB_005358 [Desulforhopalus sp.]|jgi:hypothetical protein
MLKVLSLLEMGGNGIITRIASGGDFTAELGKHWIKKGSAVRALYRKEPDAHPLMVSVDGTIWLGAITYRYSYCNLDKSSVTSQ